MGYVEDMNTAAAATKTAASLCAKAIAHLTAGDTKYISGEKVSVPFDARAWSRRKALQLSAFEPSRRVESIVAALLGDACTSQEVLDAAVADYCAAGTAEVKRLFAAAS